MSRVEKVVSGGQTGIDRMGLEVAKLVGISTGGVAPKGFLTENGPDESLRDFGLIEHTSSKYPPRTKANVLQSDGTVLFGNVETGGTKHEGKSYIVNPRANELRQWIEDSKIVVLNVAGNRGNQLSEGQIETYRNLLIEALT